MVTRDGEGYPAELLTVPAFGCVLHLALSSPVILTTGTTAPDRVTDLMAALEKTLEEARSIRPKAAALVADPDGRCLCCGAHTGEAVEVCAACQPEPDDEP